MIDVLHKLFNMTEEHNSESLKVLDRDVNTVIDLDDILTELHNEGVIPECWVITADEFRDYMENFGFYPRGIFSIKKDEQGYYWNNTYTNL